MTVALTGLSTVVADADVFACELAGGKALLDLRTSTYYSLNTVGAFVWERLQTPVTLESIRDAMIDEFEVEPERCVADLKALVNQFASAGIVRVGHARPTKREPTVRDRLAAVDETLVPDALMPRLR